MPVSLQTHTQVGTHLTHSYQHCGVTVLTRSSPVWPPPRPYGPEPCRPSGRSIVSCWSVWSRLERQPEGQRQREKGVIMQVESIIQNGLLLQPQTKKKNSRVLITTKSKYTESNDGIILFSGYCGWKESLAGISIKPETSVTNVPYTLQLRWRTSSIVEKWIL